MNAPGVGCGAILTRDGRILLIRRRRAPETGAWSLVGGKVDMMERAEDAARRECLEEVGVHIGDLALLGTSEQLMPDEGQHWLSLIFRARDFDGEPHIREPEKHSDLGWFALDGLPEPLSLAVRDAVRLLGGRIG